MDDSSALTNGDYRAWHVGGAEVQQAAGMLTVQLQVAIPEALARLEAHAARSHRPVVDVARDIIHHRLQMSPLPD
ncbi:ANTAR domain-containing protein [Pseudonocardia sp.]|uniref:ANTAR domain-containing protein n=1 Tax=Pseudonocardia sp. TaxID=60912 RepID=UPI00260565E0|nr:ANTAR domain-containing protein [Pseudonocardia sp.]MCW2719569.1 hypothetical protein [Pseudonocardia sp.]